jgi:hypothetical protein
MAEPRFFIISGGHKTAEDFFDAVERFDLTTLRCDGGDPDWLAFASALKALRKSVGYQIAVLADSYAIPLQGEFAEYPPQMADADR